jgi:hypothetical protein
MSLLPEQVLHLIALQKVLAEMKVASKKADGLQR